MDGKIGSEVSYKLEFKEGKLQAELVYDGGPVDGGLVIKLDAELVLTALKNAIPGTIDDAVIDLAIKALKVI